MATWNVTTAPPSSSPSVVASTRRALEIIRSEPGLRQKLWDNSHRLYDGLSGLGLPVGPTPSPVVAVEFEDRSAAIESWKVLIESGVYVNLVIPPASPSTNFLLRNSVSAAHSTQQIDSIIEAYRQLVERGLARTVQAA